MLASTQKKKHPQFFKTVAVKKVNIYELSDDVSGHLVLSKKPANMQLVNEGRQSLDYYPKDVFAGKGGPKMTPVFEYIHDEVEHEGKILPEGEAFLERLKLISSTAVSIIGVPDILATYTGTNGTPVTTPEADRKDYAFNVGNAKITRNGLRFAHVYINMLGTVPRVFWKWVSMFGLDLPTSSAKTASHLNGGHAALRTLINICIAM